MPTPTPTLIARLRGWYWIRLLGPESRWRCLLWDHNGWRESMFGHASICEPHEIGPRIPSPDEALAPAPAPVKRLWDWHARLLQPPELEIHERVTMRRDIEDVLDTLDALAPAPAGDAEQTKYVPRESFKPQTTGGSLAILDDLDYGAKIAQEETRSLAVHAPAGDAWQLIETAPRDGATILVTRHMPDFGWILGHSHWDGVAGIHGWISTGIGLFGELGLAHPTHWQPLPAPPRPAAAQPRDDGGNQ